MQASAESLTLDSNSSWFLPPTPPPPTAVPTLSNRPALMNWLSHKSSSIRGRSGSFNRDQPAVPAPAPPPTQQQPGPLRISEPIPIPIRDDTFFHIRSSSQRPSTGVPRPFPSIADNHATTTFERLGALKSDLPPIPASPNSPVTLRSSKSSPSLNSPTFPVKPTPMFSRVVQQPSMAIAQIQEGVMITSASAPMTPRMTPVTPTPVPLPTVSGSASAAGSRKTLSISTTASSIPPQPAFEPVLVSPQAISSIPRTMDPKHFLVTLETSQTTHRTTLATLTSKPSSIADYLNSLRDKDDEDLNDAASTSSSASSAPSPFTRAFSAHLTSQGLHESQASTSRVHIFLDRPSAPYSHILAYLRSPTTGPASLPRSAQLRGPGGSACHSADGNAKLDALYELRDEAVYLGLRELVDLCEAELKRFYSLRIRTDSNNLIEGSAPAPPLSPISARLQGRRSTEHMRKLTTGRGVVAAVPESVDETDGEHALESSGGSGKEVAASAVSAKTRWPEYHRTSLTISEGSGSGSDGNGETGTSSCTVKLSNPPVPAGRHLIRESTPVAGMTGTVVGLGTRSRSNSRVGAGGHVRTGSVVIPPSTVTTTGRTSLLPNLGSPNTPRSAFSSANWI